MRLELASFLALARCLGLAGCAVALASCSSAPIDSSAAAFGALSAPATFVWLGQAPSSTVSGPPRDEREAQELRLDDPGLLEEVRLHADEELAARGLAVTTATDAAYIAVPRVWVELRTERRDPLYSGAVAARYEIGGVGVELFDAKSGERLWDGTATARLREVSLGYGVDVVRYAPANEERKWRLPAKVRALFARFPLARR
jgi:hypothetical protein